MRAETMKRIPEPEELMDDAAQARAYAEADFSEPNNLFIELFAELLATPFGGHALDLGCGPGDIPLAFVERYHRARVTAVDGAESMLSLARSKLADQPELAERVQWTCCYLPNSELHPAGYDAVLSNSLLHHMAEPLDLWRTIKHCAKPDALVLVMDLARPATPEAVDALVATHAGDAPDVLRRDFRNSLFAAYTTDEVTEQLTRAGLGMLAVAMVSDRHLAVRGRLA